MASLSDQEAFAIAVEEAKIGYEEGGVPVWIPKIIPLQISSHC